MLKDHVFIHPKEHFEEIKSAYGQFKEMYDLYVDQPNEIDKKFLRLIYDLSHLVHYHNFADEFLNKCLSFLETHPDSLPGDTRSSLIQAIIVLHNHGVISTPALIDHLIPMFKVDDKALRRTVYGHLFNTIPKNNTNEIKKTLQKFVSHEDSRVSLKTLQLIIDIFHKENKYDSKTINFIARSLNSNNNRLINVIVAFFLDPYIPISDNGLTEKDIEELRHKAEHVLHVNSKNKKNEKSLQKVKKLKPNESKDPILVIQALNDPHKFCTRLFQLLSQPDSIKLFKDRENQLRGMQLLAKVLTSFELPFDEFYTWMHKFIRPNYENITKLLSIVASSIHRTTSTDIVYDIIKKIADNFVVDHLDEEVIIIGLNTIREICNINPFGMTPELLEDLISYKKYKVKGVIMAANGIRAVFREKRSDILPKKEIGRPRDRKEPLNYGDDEELLQNPLDNVMEIAKKRFLTDDELRAIREGRFKVDNELAAEDLESIITEGSRIRPATKEEKIELAREGKPEKHSFRNKKEDKTAGFSNYDKRKFKPYMLTRFRSASGHQKTRNMSDLQKKQKAREGVRKMKLGR